MSQLDVNIIAPLGYTGPNLPGDNNFVQIIDEFGNNVFKSPGSGNICVGTTSGYNLSSGAGNTLLGNSSGYEITIGSGNTCLGNGAGGTITGGPNNTFIGINAGNASSSYAPFIGGNNICIGSGSFASTSVVFNEITLGNSAITTLRCAVTSITSLSDARDKKNIEESKYGLDLVESLKPVTFEWETRDGAKKDVKDLGFIAQDLKEVDDDYLGLVYDENPEKLEASYGRLIPVLVKAIQELSEEVKQLKNK
jgi:hypothetical protein